MQKKGLLISKGANVNARNKAGITVLKHAEFQVGFYNIPWVEDDCKKIIRLLKSHGAYR